MGLHEPGAVEKVLAQLQLCSFKGGIAPMGWAGMPQDLGMGCR